MDDTRRFSWEQSANGTTSSYLAPPARDHPIVPPVETHHSRARPFSPSVSECVRAPPNGRPMLLVYLLMSLSRIQSLRLAAVLENYSDQLDILGHTLTVQISRERGPAAAQVTSLCSVQSPDGDEKARLAKLRRDCQYISQQLFKLHLELEEKHSFSSLQQVVEEKEQKGKAEAMRRQEEREQKQRQQDLHREEEELQQKLKKLKDLHRFTRDLLHQLNEQSSEIANKRRILEKNIKLQHQQTEKESSQAEDLLENQVELLQRLLKDEVRVHEESKKFLQNRHEELQQQLRHWQQYTKQTLQEKEQQLNSVRCKRTVNLDILTEMRRKFKEMEQVVMEDREEQEKLRLQQEKVRAATKLQAWWRGCMVRRGLGSFKKEEDKKGKKKKKDGKKKKKK